MLLGEGSRKVGEPCWSHVQCTRAQSNTHCLALVCVCDKGFHNYGGKCSRNIWEDMGLHQWEFIVVSLVLTLMAFAMFLGCVYFVISKLLRLRKTTPAENLSPSGSCKGKSGSIKKQCSVEGSSKNIRTYETKLTESSTVESQLVEEDSFVNFSDSFSTASQISEPVRFIMPLEYKSSDSERTWQSSRRSSSSQNSERSGQHRVLRAWSTTTSYDDSDDWFQPNRNHHRRLGPHSPVGMSRLPLLLRASTFSESDESP